MNSFISLRFASAVLLVVYGTAGVLGYGLHALWHHHHDLGVALSASGYSAHTHSGCNHCSCSHHAKPAADATIQVEADDCSICAFLAQAQTPAFELAVVVTVTSFDYEVSVSESIVPLFIPTDHLARGPPLG